MVHLKSSNNPCTIVVLALLSSLLLLATMSSINTFVFALKYTAELSGSNEVPPADTNAIGHTTIRTVNDQTSIKYKVNITGFSEATGAQINMGKTGENGDVVVDLLTDSKDNPTKVGMAIRGNITDSKLTGPLQGKTLADLVSAMNSGDTYINIQTSTHPDGEIRGQIEPSSGSISNSTGTSTLTETDTGNSTETG